MEGSSYLEELNPEQREAVEHRGRSLLILAGPGSGKTTVVTAKVAYLVRELHVDPRSILAVTFTKNAAQEMADRARKISGSVIDVMFKTFHGFAYWFLKYYCAAISFYNDFTVIDEDDSQFMIKEVVKDVLGFNFDKSRIRHIATVFSRLQAACIVPDEKTTGYGWRPDIAAVYFEYEQRKKDRHLLDFDDLMIKTVVCLRSNPDVAESFRKRFKYILVDEYQDTSIAQFELLQMLWTPEINICAVGDDDQSIYAFRGATVMNVLSFPEKFPGTEIINLKHNYRSTKSVVKVACESVRWIQHRLKKDIIAVRQDVDYPPIMLFSEDEKHEARRCVDLIDISLDSTRSVALKPFLEPENGKVAKPSDWAILYRKHAQSIDIQRALLRLCIPYRTLDSQELYKREEVKDFLALFSLLINPRDRIAFGRLVNKPPRFVGPTAEKCILEAADRVDGNLLIAADMVCHALPKKSSLGLKSFLEPIEDALQVLAAKVPLKSSKEVDCVDSGLRIPDYDKGLARLLMDLLNRLGLVDYYRQKDNETEACGREPHCLVTLQSFIYEAGFYSANEFELHGFFERLQFVRPADGDSEAPDAVVLSTLHGVKGLEFRRVIITGLEQTVFPSLSRQQDFDTLEAERRLFYVGVTRARDRLYLSSARTRLIQGQRLRLPPSQFLAEIDIKDFGILGSPNPLQDSIGWKLRSFGHEGHERHRACL